MYTLLNIFEYIILKTFNTNLLSIISAKVCLNVILDSFIFVSLKTHYWNRIFSKLFIMQLNALE